MASARAGDPATSLADFDWNFVPAIAIEEIAGHRHKGRMARILRNPLTPKRIAANDSNPARQYSNTANAHRRFAIGYAYRKDFFRCAYGLACSAA